MEKGDLIQLTNETYRLTRLFPQKEPLRNRIRGVAADVLSAFLSQEDALLPLLNVLEGFWAVAGEQNWVKSDLLLSVAEKYASFKREVEDIVPGMRPLALMKTEKPSQETTDFSAFVSDSHKSNERRQDKVMAILKDKGKAQVWEFKKVFPGVSKRTLRRDFECLLAQGLVERIGDKNQTFYTPKTVVI